MGTGQGKGGGRRGEGRGRRIEVKGGRMRRQRMGGVGIEEMGGW